MTEIESINPTHSELGKTSDYDHQYNPGRLFAISRKTNRRELGIEEHALPFQGFDHWNHYEVSWLNDKGKPMVATAEIIYDCNSPKLIESKSLKLYFNSFNNTIFNSVEDIEDTVKRDLESSLECAVVVNVTVLGHRRFHSMQDSFEGESIDCLDIECSVYSVEPTFLSVSDGIVSEVLCSDLLKSNCLVTNQPDWGSVQITYTGKKIDREGLLKYLVSFRNHNEFHEQCIERIFMDIMHRCKPENLTVYGRYTRRGGIDINPYRTTNLKPDMINHYRLARQ